MTYIFQPARYELLEQIRRYASVVRGRTLDIGAGSYSRYRHLFNYTEYVTVDVEGVAGVDVVGSAVALSFPDASFDSIISTQVMGDIYELRDAFAECFRVLKPGGAALITEAMFAPLHDEPYDYWRFTPYSLRRLAEDAGFTVEVIESRGGYRGVIAQMHLRYLIERYGIYHRWWSRFFNLYARTYGGFMMWRDRHDQSTASRLYAHGYLLIARKPL